MKRKTLLILLAALVSASLLAGCQNKNTDAPDNTENTENTDTPNANDTPNADEQPGGAAGNTDSEQKDDTDISGYAEAYLETVNAFNDEYKNAENPTYALIDFDGKGAPELVINMPGLVSMYTYANGRIYTLMDGFGYGVGGNGGYDYIPGGNTLRGFNNDYAGAVQYENYYHMTERYGFEPLYDKDLYITLFDDKNHNQTPDDDEPIDENTKHLYYGSSELSEKDYASMQIPGEYKQLTGETMSFDELKKALADAGK